MKNDTFQRITTARKRRAHSFMMERAYGSVSWRLKDLVPLRRYVWHEVNTDTVCSIGIAGGIDTRTQGRVGIKTGTNGFTRIPIIDTICSMKTEEFFTSNYCMHYHDIEGEPLPVIVSMAKERKTDIPINAFYDSLPRVRQGHPEDCICGVYFLITGDNEIIYVGVSNGNVQDRLEQHATKEPELAKCFLSFIVSPSPANREIAERIERVFIEHIMPRVNKNWSKTGTLKRMMELYG